MPACLPAQLLTQLAFEAVTGTGYWVRVLGMGTGYITLQRTSHHGNSCSCALQVGLDDVLHTWYRDQQVEQARNLAASCSAAACREAARNGIPASERPWVWAAALGLPAGSHVRGGSCSSGTGSISSSSCESASGSDQADCAGQRGVWWQLPSPRDDEKLQLLCSSVKQQVRSPAQGPARLACVHTTLAAYCWCSSPVFALACV
jgi:hypothetical protein